jgi:hypothetical protein
LKATNAATVQLSVPVIAASGGVAFLGESVTVRLALASVAILGGIALVILEKQNANGARGIVSADALTRAVEPNHQAESEDQRPLSADTGRWRGVTRIG